MKPGIARLGAELSRLAGLDLELRLNANRRTLISCRRPRGANGPVRASIHHAFAEAPPDVLEAVALFLRREETSASRATLRRFMAGVGKPAPEPSPEPAPSLPGEVPPSPLVQRGKGLVEVEKKLPALPPEPGGLDPIGEHHHLGRIARAVDLAYFGGECPVHVTWGREGNRPARARRRSILFGSYCSRRHLVTIHPRLDAPDVPACFVEFVVYHEMLHKAEPPVLLPSGRREVHTRAFRRRERRFARYQEAQEFEKKFIREML